MNKLAYRTHHSDKSKYGSSFSESEIVLGATFNDLDYIDRCLRDMTDVELKDFLRVLSFVFNRTNTILEEKNSAENNIQNFLDNELDRILLATKN